MRRYDYILALLFITIGLTLMVSCMLKSLFLRILIGAIAIVFGLFLHRC